MPPDIIYKGKIKQRGENNSKSVKLQRKISERKEKRLNKKKNRKK